MKEDTPAETTVSEFSPEGAAMNSWVDDPGVYIGLPNEDVAEDRRET